MKFLIEWHTKPKHREKLNKLIEKWKPPSKFKFLIPPHHVVGGHRGIGVIEVDDVEILQKGLGFFMDFVVTPIRPLLPVPE